MRRRRGWTLTILAVSAVAFLAIGGPVVADRLLTGRDLAAGSIDTRELANGAVSARKLSRRLRRSLQGRAGRAGRAGANGAAGAQGPSGPRGAAGAFNLVDSVGQVIGTFTGFYSSNYYSAMNAQGAILVYDPYPTGQNYPSTYNSSPLYYKAAGCVGTAYVNVGSYGLAIPTLIDSPPGPGSKIYQPLPGTPESFTSESNKSGTTCTTTRSGVSTMLPVREAGVLPSITRPLRVVPAG